MDIFRSLTPHLNIPENIMKLPNESFLCKIYLNGHLKIKTIYLTKLLAYR